MDWTYEKLMPAEFGYGLDMIVICRFNAFGCGGFMFCLWL